MDQMVLKTQEWLNKTYSGKHGYNKVKENGKPSWETIYGLTRALQIELGIAEPADNFGPATESKFVPLKKQKKTEKPTNLNYILQGAFWCKGSGFNPGGLTGNFFESTEDAVKRFQRAAGLAKQDGVVTAQIMKALLNMSAFKLLRNGDTKIRQIQQNLNRDYNAYFGLMPCDGVYSRETNKALIYALQKEEGMSTSVANGNFGPGTTSKCPTLKPGDSRTKFVLILQYALYCNGYPSGEFDGVYDAEVESAVSRFQSFMCLPATGIANMATIKALLSSSGDTSRAAAACDTSTVLTAATAKTLRNNGYKVVGRYLTGNVRTSSGLKSKAMTPAELSIIFNEGLRVFPIYQDGGYESSYFVQNQGTTDAYAAVNAAQGLGFPSGTTIYFAVDFDAYDYEVTDKIIPYFNEIKAAFDKMQSIPNSPKYKIGVYGPRNICIRTADAGLTEYSFVADMSTGFSGNLGYTMPKNWAFDQFYEQSIGSGSGMIGIDKDAYSGRDKGTASVTPSSDPVYDARVRTLRNILANIPALSSISELFTTMFIFDKTETVYKSLYLDITLSTSLVFKKPSETSPGTLQVKNGKVGASITEVLGNSKTSLSSSQIHSYDELLKNIGLSVRNGYISVNVSPSVESLDLSLTIFSNEIPVVGDTKTEMSATITFKIKKLYVSPSKPVVAPQEALPIDWGAVGVAVGGIIAATVGVAAVVIVGTAAPEIAIGTAVSAVLFAIFGEKTAD
ncbi:glycoside hydrolase domain-containing protein [Bacillus sp. JJ675]|uniref:glycoside hydrolase domain-containing protein n=1 Tax=Bacillus sp. JJ675 TaxID=3122972 RepID=UPI002FFF227B